MWRLVAIGLLTHLAPVIYAFTAPPSGVTATGSGFFVSADGYFLTNYHVIRGAKKVQILSGDFLLETKMIRTDATNDIALLKAEGNFGFLPLGRSDSASLGQDVFTIGFPNPAIQGFAPKLTRGDISATTGMHDDPRLLQISVPVQPGNSGSPVIDESGRVIGIISSSLSALRLLRDTGALPQNVNYAIKSSYASTLMEGLITTNDSGISISKERPQLIAAAKKAVGLVLIYGDDKKNETASHPAPQQNPRSTNQPKITTEDLERMNAVNGQNGRRLVHAPFPVAARELGLRGAGRFRIHFAPSGRAVTIYVERSTGYKQLDDATKQALLTWKAEPGTMFDFVVPMLYTDN